MRHAAWWGAGDERDVATAAVRALSAIRDAQSARVERTVQYLRLYGDPHADLARPRSIAYRDKARPDFAPARLSYNVIRNLTNAAVSKIGKSEPAPFFLSVRGDEGAQSKARTRTRYVNGVWHDTKARRAFVAALQVGVLTGTGVVKIVPRDGRVVVEHLLPGDLWVDDHDGSRGSPSSLIESRYVARGALRALYPDVGDGDDGEQVEAVEAWHPPAAPGGDDGLHVVCLGDGTPLAQEPIARHPFAVFRWATNPMGWHGTGLGEELLGVQIEIEAVLRQIQANVQGGANLKVLVPRGSRITQAHLTDALGGVLVEYDGTPPTYLVPPVVDSGLLRYLDSLIQRAYEMTGISQLSAAGNMPTGLAGSGRAQLVYANIESERFIETIRAWEGFHVDAAELTLRAAAALGPDAPAVHARGKGSWLDVIRPEDLDMDEDAPLSIQVHSTANLPNTPAGKLAYVGQLAEMQVISDPAEMRALLDMPDTDASERLESAPGQLIDAALEAIIERGEAVPPTPLMNLAAARKRGTLAYNRAQLDGAPLDRLDLLSQWIVQVDDLMSAGATPPAPSDEAPPDAGMTPEGMPPEGAGVPPGAPIQ